MLTILLSHLPSPEDSEVQRDYSRCPKGASQWLSGKESTCNAWDAGDSGSIHGSGRFLGGGNSNPLQYSCILAWKSPMDRPWQATVPRVTKSWTQLNMRAARVQDLQSDEWYRQALNSKACQCLDIAGSFHLGLCPSWSTVQVSHFCLPWHTPWGLLGLLAPLLGDCKTLLFCTPGQRKEE